MHHFPIRLLSALAWSFGLGAAGHAQQPGDSPALAQVGRFEFSARNANATQLPPDRSGRYFGGTAMGAGGSALGAVVAPMYGAGLMVGGLILVPLGLFLVESERRPWQTVVDALQTIDFPKATLEAMQRRAARALPARSGPLANAEMVVIAFGLMGRCFIVDAEIAVQLDEKEVIRSPLRILASAGEDAPRAQCASLETFAANNGQLLKDTVAEYAEVLAAMAIERIAREMIR
jgi:hypothetical protein